MARPKRNNQPDPGNYFRFNLVGLVIFSVCLMAGASLITERFFNWRPQPYSFADNLGAPDPQDKNVTDHIGPWGELLTQNIKLERPAELIAGEVVRPPAETWVFRNMTVVQVKALFTANGLTTEQAENALAADRVSAQGKDTIFVPGEDFIFSLSPEKRQKLYEALYGMGVNTYLDWPFIFSKNEMESIYADARLHSDDVALLKKLLYPSGNALHLSDWEMLLHKIPTLERRTAMSQVLSRQSAVLAGLCIRPDTDIDKIASYWGKMDNVRFNDIRPLMQALKELPHGGRISLLFLLPPFARERLYTFPVHEENDPAVMDCHWSTFNFSSVEPDNHFADPNYTIQYLQKNYYQITEPSIYGDIILYMNDRQEFKHSAVYLADDLAFTKYGDNYSQPWMIVRIPDMQAEYSRLKPVYFRLKTN